MSKVDIVLIKPGSQKQLYGELNAFELTAIEPPLWGAILAGYLRSKGYSVLLYDAELENWSYDQTAEKIKDADPVLAAVVVSGTNPSASTMNMTGAGRILSVLQEIDPSINTLLSGLHPSALPKKTLLEEDVDFVCQGEGFDTLCELIRALKNNAEDFPIKGLWYKKDAEVIGNPRAELKKNLDNFPPPAWDMLKIKDYRAHNWHCFENIKQRQPYAAIYTSLGCPFQCSFCCINALFGKPGIRYRSPANVIEEIDFLVNKYDVRNIKIVDEMFALNKRHVDMFCDLIIERGYGLNMWAYARVDTVDQNMLRKMKQAGINWIAYGFESASSKVLNDVTKGYDSNNVNDVVKMTYNEGLYICANYIFGLPEDDHDSMQETLDMAMDINAEWANMYSTMAYPGSKLYEDAIEKGLSLPDTWQGYSQYAYESHPLATKYLSSDEILSFRDHAFHVYHESPRYLAKIKGLFGEETVKHIQKMTKHRLRRKMCTR